MPGKADTYPQSSPSLDRRPSRKPARDAGLTSSERVRLEGLQRQALQYFLDNQPAHGLILDRQRNHGSCRHTGLCSTAGTGMGLMALALASRPEYGLLGAREARYRVLTCLETVLEHLPQDHGMLPHFVDTHTLEPVGADHTSTIDSSWLLAGALWAADLLDDAEVQSQAARLYRRVDWRYWSQGLDGLLHHGKDRQGRLLCGHWDRCNAETAFMYLLGIGASAERALPADCWAKLDPCYGQVAGHRFASADLGLFVFQYSLELLDLVEYEVPGAVDLYAEARTATRVNYLACRAAAEQYRTYRDYWGLSAGDGPGTDGADAYRCYSPLEGIDGTAHLTATLASLCTWPGLVLENIEAAEHERRVPVRGRYGYSNVNLDRGWVSRDVVAIDLGAAALALDNVLHDGRVRRVLHGLECVRRGLERLQLRRRAAALRQAS